MPSCFVPGCRSGYDDCKEADMIEKKDEISLPSSSNADLSVPVTSLAQSHQLLQLTTSQVQAKLRESFARLSEALQSREKQLLRQVDVLHSQQLALLQSCNSLPSDCIINDVVRAVPQVTVDLEQERSLCEAILSFGKVDVEGSLIAIEGNVPPLSVPYRLEDYQDAKEDHMCLYKPLSNQSTPQQEVVRFSFAPRLKGSSNSPVQIQSPNTEKEEFSEPQPPVNSSFISDSRRPSQVEQWLQQIMAETEVEPSVGEQEKNFASLNHIVEPGD